MIKEEAIVYSLSITKPGERRYFQIKLPDDTKRIIGIEWGAISNFYAQTGNYIDPEWWQFPLGNDLSFQVKPTKVIGELTLQAMGAVDMFYRGEFVLKDSNLFWADMSRPDLNQFDQWSHGKKREELSIDTNDIVIEAYYRDRWGIINELIARYQFHLYIWIEKCEP